MFANWAVDTRAEISDVQVKSDANGSTFLEFFSSKAFPLDLATTSAAAWKLAGLSLGKLPNGHYGVRRVRFCNAILSLKPGKHHYSNPSIYCV